MIEKSKNSFNKNVEKIIELMDKEVFVIYRDKSIKCTCGHNQTGQPNPSCIKCLGTGHKIKIRKKMCACQESSGPKTVRTTSMFIIAKSYYFKMKDSLKNDDIIIDGDEIAFVFQASDFSSFDGKKIYQKCICVDKKSDTNILLENFNKIIGR